MDDVTSYTHIHRWHRTAPHPTDKTRLISLILDDGCTPFFFFFSIPMVGGELLIMSLLCRVQLTAEKCCRSVPHRQPPCERPTSHRYGDVQTYKQTGRPRWGE